MGFKDYYNDDISDLDEKWSYAVLLYFNESIIHAIGYKVKPSQLDLNDLRRELKEDKEFGLNKIANNVPFIIAPFPKPLTGKQIAEKMEELNKKLEELSSEDKTDK